MSVGRTGLVSHIQEDLERAISLGLLPRDGFLPSEQLLARQYGVSRMTAREVLLRLAARGLVVQHPGRRSRAVPLREAVTLENLSVALHGVGQGHPEEQWLLEGYFALKRETAVELLAACCEQASEEELSRLENACFALAQTAPWEELRRWVDREFELLWLATRATNRPGQFLLVQSLERSFWGIAGWLMPHLDCELIRQWSWCAYHALCERNVQALRGELPALLQAGDERLLGHLVSACNASNRYACLTGSGQTPSKGTLPPTSEEEAPGAVPPNWSSCHTGSLQPPPAWDSLPEPGGGTKESR